MPPPFFSSQPQSQALAPVVPLGLLDETPRPPRHKSALLFGLSLFLRFDPAARRADLAAGR